MKNTLIIPDRIKVGFQNRQDTYTGKLAFVTWIDNKNKLKQEASWNNWRDKNILPFDFDNTPTEGFVLNKKVGGVAEKYSWNVRNEYVRVFDPRGFEFEISVPNLLFILQECSAIKGKGLEGQFVYAWEGSKVILLPITSQEYKESSKFTKLQTKKIAPQNVVPGNVYLTKKNEQVVYLGKFPWVKSKHHQDTFFYSLFYQTNQKKNNHQNYHVFVYLNQLQQNQKDQYNHTSLYLVDKGFTKLADIVSDEPITNFAEIFDGFSKSKFAGKPVKFLEKTRLPAIREKHYGDITVGHLFRKINDCTYEYVSIAIDYRNPYAFRTRNLISTGQFEIKNNTLYFVKQNRILKYNFTIEQINNEDLVGLDIQLSNGLTLPIEKY